MEHSSWFRSESDPSLRKRQAESQSLLAWMGSIIDRLIEQILSPGVNPQAERMSFTQEKYDD
ncbi:MAG: hypothetical protein ACI87E_003757 [Mariniblastus sp.]|jgi:hypothetical protein